MTRFADWVAEAGWGTAKSEPLAGDASARRYWRLHMDGRTAILMDDPAGQTERFADVAQYLRGKGLSAPTVLAHDPRTGGMLLEDLGSSVYANMIAVTPDAEVPLYEAAADMLARLHDATAMAGLDAATPARLVAMTDLFFDHYLPFCGHTVGTEDRAGIEVALLDALETWAGAPDVTILRDFHAENLVWMPDRDGVRRVGLLDFQDAMLGHRAYDLASLLRDARRSVSPAAEKAAIARYLAVSGQNAGAFSAQFAVLSVQRNLRILGIFVRLARHLGKRHYLQFLPRVLRHLATDLQHPALKDLSAMLRPALIPCKPISALLFAAGFGTRMRPLTDHRPKPLIEVAGKTLLDHALEQVDACGPMTTVVNAYYLADQIENAVTGRSVSVSVERPDILDTGGGLRQALPLMCPGPVFTLNTDAVWSDNRALALLRDSWDENHMSALLLCVPLQRAVGRAAPGDFAMAADGRLSRGGDWVYTGVQVVQPGAVNEIQQTVFSLNLLWDRFAAQGRLYGCEYRGTWCDVGHPAGIALAETLLKGRQDV